eukprot:365891-Chlamydomonas_euryale.AAC.6
MAAAAATQKCIPPRVCMWQRACGWPPRRPRQTLDMAAAAMAPCVRATSAIQADTGHGRCGDGPMCSCDLGERQYSCCSTRTQGDPRALASSLMLISPVTYVALVSWCNDMHAPSSS